MAQEPVEYYAVTFEWGEGRSVGRAMREQERWDEHATYMDVLVDESFIVLGGPLDGEERVLLIINAKSRQEVEARFAADPWIAMDIRRITKVERWKILLDARRE